MFEVLKSSWALLLGMLMLMLGNGLQSSLLGVRGGEAGFSAFQLSVVMSSYFAGFLLASRMTPELIRRVGHVRVFAALGERGQRLVERLGADVVESTRFHLLVPQHGEQALP